MLIFCLWMACQPPPTLEALSVLLGKWSEFDQQLAQIQNPHERDLLLLSLSVQHPRYSGPLCARIQTDGAKEKCQQVLGRPHLSTP